MKKNIITAALLLAAIPAVLTSCSKSPEEKMVDLMEEISAIVSDTTAENADDMLEKLSKMEGKVKEIAQALENADHSSSSKLAEPDEKTKKVVENMMKASVNLEMRMHDMSEVDREKVNRVMQKIGELIFAK